jgi:DNA repair exonuclease SbcCD ATPase subunit
VASPPDVMEVQEQIEIAKPDAGQPGLSDAFDLMRAELAKPTTAPAAPSDDDDLEGAEIEAAAPPSASPTTEPTDAPPQPKPAPSLDPNSRVGKIVAREVGKVKSESDATIAALEAKLRERDEAETTTKHQQQAQQLEQEYGAWIGSGEQYTEAMRLSRMDPDAEGWDWEAHKAAVNNLDQWDERRKWADLVHESGKTAGAVEANTAINQDFLVTLAGDLPEDKREAYRGHKDGIPGAVRFYAETVAAPKLEALEGRIAELEAENERLSRSGGTSRSPAPGGIGGGGSRGPILDYKNQSPEQLMQAELRAQAAQNGRRR